MTFTAQSHSGIDKSFEVTDGFIEMRVDYDDVNHKEVDCALEAMLFILNKYSTEYTDMRDDLISKIPKCPICDCYLEEDGSCDWC